MVRQRLEIWGVLLACAVVLGSVSVVDAKKAKYKVAKKVRHHEKVIVLNHDDLPKNGQHWYCVPPPAPIQIVDTFPPAASQDNLRRTQR